ncbi:MAG: hypothetical protein EHM72_08945 [Calditrichaeota bacterium]|nr:MAG: hypothetical protein EHM72_08945 [Calditrichota bacterium]
MKLIGLLVVVLFLCSTRQNLGQEAGVVEPVLEPSYELGGTVRGVYCAGAQAHRGPWQTKSAYAETAFKLMIGRHAIGKAFADLRFRRALEEDTQWQSIDLREGYVRCALDPFEFSFGRQIVVWGRADGFNPTNNLTSWNYLMRSADEDDYRIGNFMLRTRFHLAPLHLEGVWLPQYQPSQLPIELFTGGIDRIDEAYPNPRLSNSSVALKADVQLYRAEGSLSYFYGFNPLPGIGAAFQSSVVDMLPMVNFYLTACRLHIVGADYASSWGRWGVRGEAAWRKPDYKDQNAPFVPLPDLQVILGVDRQWGRFHMLFQYMGHYVFDFDTALPPGHDLADQINFLLTQKNRLLLQQTEQVSHSFFARSSLTMLHDLATAELAGMVNFTTQEYLVRAKFVYDLADALQVKLSGEHYFGPSATLFGLFGDFLSGIIVELVYSF